jgi:hypothetical protein
MKPDVLGELHARCAALMAYHRYMNSDALDCALDEAIPAEIREDDDARRSLSKEQKMAFQIEAMEKLPLDNPKLYEKYLEIERDAVEDKNRGRYHQVNILDRNDTIVSTFACRGSKPRTEWYEFENAAEAMSKFNPNGATLSNGFDIYTAGVNSTLPTPVDGEINSGYCYTVLLRNVRVLPAQEEYVMTAPKEPDQSVIKHKELGSFSKDYCSKGEFRRCECPSCALVVRRVEGIFFFNTEPETYEEMEALKEKNKDVDEKKNAETETYLRRRRLARDARRARLKKRNEALRELKAEKAKEMKAQQDEESQEELEEDANQHTEEESSESGVSAAVETRHEISDVLASIELVPAPVTESIGSPRSPRLVIPVKEKPKRQNNKVSELEREVAQAEWELDKEKNARRCAVLERPVEFTDLHAFVKNLNNIVKIQGHELGAMMHQFALKRDYKTEAGETVTRKMKCVKVEMNIKVDGITVFDVDDLLLDASSIDHNPQKYYNVVVTINNYERWVLESHAHTGNEKVGSEKLDRVLEDFNNRVMKVMNGKKSKYGEFKVGDLLETIRVVAAGKGFEKSSLKRCCYKPHAEKGITGEMPSFSASRFYVSRN